MILTISALRALPVLSAAWLFIGVLIIGAFVPSYSHLSDFMSVLGATGAMYASWANYLVFIPTELVLLAFLFCLYRFRQQTFLSRLAIVVVSIYAILLMAAAFLPCDMGCLGDTDGQGASFSHKAHMTIATLAYPLGLVGSYMLCKAVSRRRKAPTFISLLTGVGIGLYVAIAIFPDVQGLSQRLIEAVIYGQLIYSGWSSALANRDIKFSKSSLL
ncbi:MAG: DUF998 domain-containing protein [Alphaproteobacteria bacterium]|nr:DUF998 domain-containing protein [Alphaproteobacteria bacterium]